MAGETVLNGRYQLLAQQGSGGMSVIYKALDRALGRTVAIKILRPSLTKDPSFLEKFRNEARAVANLSHPNIVTVYDVGSEGLTHYIVMEMVDGKDLKKIIKDSGALPINRAVDLSIDICSGLGYAHRSGLVHADVKPQNILVTPQDIVKVTDFGIAQALTDTHPQQRSDVVWGSPHYFAPEQARGEAPTPQSDVYAVGIVMFELLTGELPYTGTTQKDLAMAHIQDPIPNIESYNPNVPDRLAKVIYRAMAKNPRDRFRDADQLGNLLNAYRNRARDNTVVNIPKAQTPPKAPVDRPPHIGGQSRPQVHESEETVKYSAAPDAPKYYDPRQQPAVQNPIAQAPQPFEQRFTPPAPQQSVAQPAENYPSQAAPVNAYPQSSTPYPPRGDSGAFPMQRSQPLITVDDDDKGFDFVTIALGIIAFLAVAGVMILWIVIISSL